MRGFLCGCVTTALIGYLAIELMAAWNSTDCPYLWKGSGGRMEARRDMEQCVQKMACIWEKF